MGQKVTLEQMEEALRQKFKGKNCSFTYPGYQTVYGLVDEITINVLDKTECVLIMKSKRYIFELSSLKEHLQLLKREP